MDAGVSSSSLHQRAGCGGDGVGWRCPVSPKASTKPLPVRPGAKTVGQERSPADQASGAEFTQELSDKPWGKREFGIRTIDGHRLMFGQER